MKITKTPDMIRGSINATNTGSIGGVIIGPPSVSSNSGGQAIISSASNTASWQPVISTITAGGTVLLGPNVAIAAGSNITLAVSSNTVTISGSVGNTVYALGNLGSTEVINFLNGGYQWGTLNAHCAISFTGWTSGVDCQITLELNEDGTGGWTPTFSGVTWLGGTTPTHTTTASTRTIYAFFSRDGGTTIIGGQLGGSTVTDLDDLTDVVITNAQLGDILRRGTSVWEDYAGHYEPVTHDPGSGPEIVFTATDIVMEWTI